ncbi:hypothetical protein B0H10DRAFT_1160455 [Mycena sp. CBHHK59/15]|nr:hypothetical protein B0H10DRAFT_1160455 [Mycena sp. CBHHK59/15]
MFHLFGPGQTLINIEQGLPQPPTATTSMPKASSSARIRRPGALKDLPLYLFLPPNPSLPPRPNKRAHSPGVPSLFSPTKRSILAEEGIISEGSPKWTLRVRALRDVGGDGPVNFGTLPNTFTPTSASSPLSRDDRQEKNDYLSPLPDFTLSRPARVAIPSELPSPADPQSIHCPGFQVCLDTFTVTDPVVNHDSDTSASSQREEQKENVPPRRKPRKSVPALASDSPGPKSKADSTPRRSLGRERSNSATPTSRRPDVVLTQDTRSTARLSDMQRREMKRRLAEEVNEIGSEDEDPALL